MQPAHPWKINLYRSMTKWEWVVENMHDVDDFVRGENESYIVACADALAAMDDCIFRRTE